jgi:outer membrane protein OmpA-like peptidoglycan-associated protein
MAADAPKQGSQLGQMGRELLTQLLPLLVTAGGLTLLLFAVGSAVSVARFSAAGLPWEQAISAAAESDIRTTGLVWLVMFGLLGLLAVTLAYVASPQGEATAAMYYALIAIATAEALVVWFAAKEGEIFDPTPRDVGALVTIIEATLGAALVVLAMHIPAARRARDAARKAASRRYGRDLESRLDPSTAQPTGSSDGDKPPNFRIVGLVAALGAVAAILLLLVDPDGSVVGSAWGYRILVVAGAILIVGAVFVWDQWERNERPTSLGAQTKTAREKTREAPIALTFWWFLVLGLLSIGAGAGAALFLGNGWVAPAVIFAGVLGILAIRVAELTGTFRWYAVSVFFGVGLFGAVVGVLRMLDEPRLQPVAFLVKDGKEFIAVEGVYVGKSDDELWYASVALDDCGDDKVRSGSGRLRSVPEEDVRSLSIGPQMGLPKLAYEARAMVDAVMTEHGGRERVAGPAAVRDAVALQSLSTKRRPPGTWVTVEKTEGLGTIPTLTLNGRRLRVHQVGGEDGQWKVRLPRRAASGPVYADCAERTNKAFLTVPRRPLTMVTATALGDGEWRLEARGSRDPDGQIEAFSWETGGRELPSRRTVEFEVKNSRQRVVRLTARDADGLTAGVTVTLRGRIVRVYQSDLLFRFDQRKLTPRGERRVRALRDETAGARRVEIYAHTDERGGAAHNRSVSIARANAVARALLGSRANMAQARGMGEERPVESGNHRENRRVVVVIS